MNNTNFCFEELPVEATENSRFEMLNPDGSLGTSASITDYRRKHSRDSKCKCQELLIVTSVEQESPCSFARIVKICRNISDSIFLVLNFVILFYCTFEFLMYVYRVSSPLMRSIF